jgi:hypothetical protein
VHRKMRTLLAAGAIALAMTTSVRAQMPQAATKLLLKQPSSKKIPYQVIAVADRWDASRYGSFPMVGHEASDSPATDSLTQPVTPVSTANLTDNPGSGPLVLSSLTTLQVIHANPRQTIQNSPQLAGLGIYSLLADRSAAESFLHGHSANYLSPPEWSADNETPALEIGEPSRPLLQLEFGGSFPVMLSNPAISR